MLTISEITIDQRVETFGITSQYPTISWKLKSDQKNILQKNYHIQVFTEKQLLWDSGMIESGESQFIQYAGEELFPHQYCQVKLSITDGYEEKASAVSQFFTGKLMERWQGKWIGSKRLNDKKNLLPPELFEKKFSTDKKVISAKLYASALGIYEGTINGERIGENYFAPGYSHYQSELQFQAYDITEKLKQDNTLRFTVANGWYLGTIGRKNNNYGKQRGLIAELHLWYADGEHEIIATDESWKCTVDTSDVYADFYCGQTIDGIKEKEEHWRWSPVVLLGIQKQRLIPEFGGQVKEECRLQPIDKKEIEGKYIYDFGQNHAGILHVWVDAHKGTVLTYRHGEIINEDGSLFTKNLRGAKQQLTFICGKDGVQEFAPKFTFMGFRYVEFTASQPVEIKSMESIVLTTDGKVTGEFACSDLLLTRFQQNIQWGQRSNFIEIPTDCPQRDERMGWTGDIAVFASTAAFNRDISAFMRKWLQILRLDQRENGTLPVTIPKNDTYEPTPFHIPIAIWGDAATMVPWAVYMAYGDKTMLAKQYDSMKAFVESEIRAAAKHGRGSKKYLWDKNPFQYGDWCAAGEGYSQWKKKGRFLSTAYMANSVKIMIKAAQELDKQKDKEYFTTMLANIRYAFFEHFITKEKQLTGDFQSNYVCALYFDLIPENMKKKMAEHLAMLVRENDYCVMTGFAGTPYIAFALADNGYVEDAYKHLQNTKCPGWLYTVKAGGTTVWERWDALDENGHMKQLGKKSIADMVSFNHYAYGAVGDFFYRRILGIEAISPGYQNFRIKPVPGGTLTEASGSLETGYGIIQVQWNRVENTHFHLQVTIPANTKAEIILPNGEHHITGSGTYQFD